VSDKFAVILVAVTKALLAGNLVRRLVSQLTASSGWQDSNLRVRYFGTRRPDGLRSFTVTKF
jgi:hypothetical protein